MLIGKEERTRLTTTITTTDTIGDDTDQHLYILIVHILNSISLLYHLPPPPPPPSSHLVSPITYSSFPDTFPSIPSPHPCPLLPLLYIFPFPPLSFISSIPPSFLLSIFFLRLPTFLSIHSSSSSSFFHLSIPVFSFSFDHSCIFLSTFSSPSLSSLPPLH